MKKIRLFCFPYAGGSALIYSKWKRSLDKSIEIHPVEMAGRGKRILEPLYRDMKEAVNDLYESIKEHFAESEYAFLGHSMGSWIVYELGQKIIQNRDKQPIHIFVAGNRAPHVHKEEKILHNLPDDELKEEIINIGGTAKEIFEDEDLASLFLPIIRADYELTEKYQYTKMKQPFECDISVLNGTEDDLTFKELDEWRQYSTGKCKLYNFSGGHFFIHDNVEKITKLINGELIVSKKNF